MLKDSQPASQYTFTKLLKTGSFNMELQVSRGKKKATFNLEKLQDFYNLEGDGKVFQTVWHGCQKAGLVPKKCELAFLKAYFEFLDYKK